jgi:hypothetical protein
MVKNISHRNQLEQVPTSTQKEVSYYMFEFVKMYLYSEYTSSKNIVEFEVLRMTAIAENGTGKPKHVSVSDEKGSDYLRVSDSCVDATFDFKQVCIPFSFVEKERITTKQKIISPFSALVQMQNSQKNYYNFFCLNQCKPHRILMRLLKLLLRRKSFLLMMTMMFPSDW